MFPALFFILKKAAFGWIMKTTLKQMWKTTGGKWNDRIMQVLVIWRKLGRKKPGCELDYWSVASASSYFQPVSYKYALSIWHVELQTLYDLRMLSRSLSDLSGAYPQLRLLFPTCLASTTRSVNVLRRKRCAFSTFKQNLRKSFFTHSLLDLVCKLLLGHEVENPMFEACPSTAKMAPH